MEEGKVLFEESMSDLTARFREVRVAREAPADVPANWPVDWLDPRAEAAMLRFVDSRFSEAGFAEQIRGVILDATRLTWRQWGCARFLRPWRERRAFGPKRRLARNQDRRRSEWFGTSSRRTGSCCGRSRSRSSLRASGPFHAAADNSPGEAFGLDDHEIARCVTAGSASAGFSLQFLQNAYMRVTSAGGRVRILAGLRYSGI